MSKALVLLLLILHPVLAKETTITLNLLQNRSNLTLKTEPDSNHVYLKLTCASHSPGNPPSKIPPQTRTPLLIRYDLLITIVRTVHPLIMDLVGYLLGLAIHLLNVLLFMETSLEVLQKLIPAFELFLKTVTVTYRLMHLHLLVLLNYIVGKIILLFLLSRNNVFYLE